MRVFLLSHLFLFFFNHVNIVLIPVWLTFAGAIATAEGDTSSNIAKMIEELTQSEGTEVLKISVEETLVSTTGATGESSQLEDLPSPTYRLGNISKRLDISLFSIIINTIG